jgi:hypothetical protein
MISYRQFKFGWATAELEGASHPALLLQGFFDSGIVRQARFGQEFLVLGYKGSGKSAVSEHLRLTAEADPHLFVTSAFLADFPYNDFSRLVQGDDPEVRYPTAWSWLLLVKLYDSFLKDEGGRAEAGGEFQRNAEILAKLGLLPSRSLKELVLSSSTKTFRVKLPVVFESEFRRDKHEQNLKLPFFVERLKATLCEFRSESRHLLIIDGLDDILLASGSRQYDSLAGLVLEVSRLNSLFSRNGCPAKILLLCRTDMYERLPGANKNKIRQDSAITLDWYHDPRQPGQSNLVKMLNLKAQVTDPGCNDVFATYFPPEMIWGHNEQQPMASYLLDFTRHTPRDFVQVLTHIQPFAAESRQPSLIRRQLTQEQILSGLRSYSINYFLPEIKDELVGYFSSEQVNAMIDLIGSLRKREFRFSELEQKASGQKRYSDLDLSGAIAALFECSAIGNVHNKPTGNTYFTFKYRNRHSTLSLQDRLLLHRGMWKALNLV